ncbi:MAG: PLD nuclease N-terminal domain-containing protein [Chloroflexota bacterium]
MEIIQKYLPLLIPIVLIELGLMIAALMDLARRPQTRGPKWVWVLVIILINFIGPIIYFVTGRKDE